MKDKIRISAFIPFVHSTEEEIKNIADAGINYVILHTKWYKVGEITEHTFDLFEKYGIEVAFADENLNDTKISDKDYSVLNLETTDKMYFKDKKSFVSYAYADEPSMDEFPSIGKEIDKFYKLFPGKSTFVNLYPMHPGENVLKGKNWENEEIYKDSGLSIYEIYLKEFVKYIDVPYISFDIYPLACEEDPSCPEMFPVKHIKTVYPGYIKNFEYVSKACRESGRDLWVFVQTCSWSRTVKEPTADEIKMQMYVALSYGAKNILYYVYASYFGHSNTMINCRGDKTQLYFDVRDTALGIRKLSDVYVQYRNLGAFNVNSSREKSWYLEMNTPYEDFDIIEEIESTTPVLVGCFEKIAGNGYAFTLCNMQYFGNPKESEIHVKIQGKITEYRDGEPKVLTQDNGYYNFKLNQGEGIFVTVE